MSANNDQPAAAQEAMARSPFSDEEIDALLPILQDGWTIRDYATWSIRAAERAHGITFTAPPIAAAPVGNDVPFTTVQRVVRALTQCGIATPYSHEEQAARALELIHWLCEEVPKIFASTHAESGIDPTPRQMDTAPRDGTMLRLLVQFEDNATEDTEGPAWTIGHNNLDNDGEDCWQFAGWCWSHDHYTSGMGTPVGWLPLHDASPKGGSDAWQPMETAPKSEADGSRVEGIYLLGYVPDADLVDQQAAIDVIWWEPLLPNSKGGRGKWCANLYGEAFEVSPTKWQHLPSAPATSAEVKEERCESGRPDCGPVEHWDSEAVPLCARCWKELTTSHGAGVSG